MKLPENLTYKQVAEYFNCSESTVRRWVDMIDEFPRPFKLFGTVRFRREEIEAFFDKYRDE
jgi:predicted DNA-binding transcriptional regulator AlpA